MNFVLMVINFIKLEVVGEKDELGNDHMINNFSFIFESLFYNTKIFKY